MSDHTAMMDAPPDAKLVLLVDDEFDILSTYTMLFEYSGFRVATAANGRLALAAAALEQPAIVVSDFMMPSMDGAELCRAWRDDEQLQPIPFILCSAGIVRDHASIPYDSFFRKPVPIDKLIKEVRRLLLKGRAQE
ncbi:response regulator [Janthinobacterium psychrotolerans]|nr:response regulator [Janthinobacterium psychrotolerans]